ncbi:MAG: hypothetical protein ACI4LS_00405, partial [Treponema sp.]
NFKLNPRFCKLKTQHIVSLQSRVAKQNFVKGFLSGYEVLFRFVVPSATPFSWGKSPKPPVKKSVYKLMFINVY